MLHAAGSKGNRLLAAGFGQVERPDGVEFFEVFHNLLPFPYRKEDGCGGLVFIDDVLGMKSIHDADFQKLL